LFASFDKKTTMYIDLLGKRNDYILVDLSLLLLLIYIYNIINIPYLHFCFLFKNFD